MLPRAARVRHLETGLYPTAACGTLCRLEVGYISSPDGGAHWGPAIQLAGPMAPSQIALTSQGPMVDVVHGRTCDDPARGRPSAADLDNVR